MNEHANQQPTSSLARIRTSSEATERWAVVSEGAGCNAALTCGLLKPGLGGNGRPRQLMKHMLE